MPAAMTLRDRLTYGPLSGAIGVVLSLALSTVLVDRVEERLGSENPKAWSAVAWRTVWLLGVVLLVWRA